ncbi:GNAT family N-acetyltransferase [Reyranella sp.]|uniref:GNAT family N-acetyltransferase n=1 Tax=Reyranella sp. TaxID=1929291 RepID=UPI003D099688
METTPCSIDGELVTARLAGRMEDTMQAFAVRAACFIGEQDVPYSEEFDGQDFGATHLVAYLGSEPVGALRIRWFQSFAMPERLAVMQRFRGHQVGRLLLERARTLAESRGCKILYTRLSPGQATYFEKQGWRRLDDGRVPGARPTVALVRPVDPANQSAEIADTDAIALSTQYRLDMPAGAVA